LRFTTLDPLRSADSPSAPGVVFPARSDEGRTSGVPWPPTPVRRLATLQRTGRSRSLSPASVKRAGFRDPEHLPPTGSSTRSPCPAPARCRPGAFRRRPFATSRVSASQLGSIRYPQPQPGTACASQTPPVDFCLSNTTREHTDAGSSSLEGAFSSLSGDHRTEVPDLRAVRSRPKPGYDARERRRTGRGLLDPACAQRRRGQLELSPDTSLSPVHRHPDPGAVVREGAPTKAPFHPRTRMRKLPENRGAFGCQWVPRRRYPPEGTAGLCHPGGRLDPDTPFSTCPLAPP
jgi:hypothetical protein